MTDHLQLTLPETIEELRRLVNHLDVMTRQAAEDEIENVQEAVELLVALNSVKASLNTAYAGYEETIAKEMESTYQLNLPGGIEVTRREGRDRKKWDHQRLAKTIAERLVDESVDWETGEVLMDTQDIVTALLKYGHVDYWRVKELKKIGLNPDKYCEVEDGKISVAIKRTG